MAERSLAVRHDLTARLATANVTEHADPTDAGMTSSQPNLLSFSVTARAVRLIKIKRQDCGQDKFRRLVSNTKDIE